MRIKVVTNRSRSMLALTLAALLAVFGIAAPLMSTSLRAERLGDGPAPGEFHRRHLEAGRISCRKAPLISLFSGEYAEIKEVESNEEEREHPPVVTFGDLLRLFGSTHASDARQRRGPPALPPDRLFLLCGHLVC
jgi:hypothetical protein